MTNIKINYKIHNKNFDEIDKSYEKIFKKIEEVENIIKKYKACDGIITGSVYVDKDGVKETGWSGGGSTSMSGYSTSTGSGGYNVTTGSFSKKVHSPYVPLKKVPVTKVSASSPYGTFKKKSPTITEVISSTIKKIKEFDFNMRLNKIVEWVKSDWNKPVIKK